MKKTWRSVLFLLPVLGGLGALGAILADRSEEKSALLWGFSAFRLGLAAAALVFTLFAFLIYSNRRKNLTFLYYLSAAAFWPCAVILLLGRWPSDDSRNLIPLIADRAAPLLICLALSAAVWRLALSCGEEEPPDGYTLFVFCVAVLSYLAVSSHIAKYNWSLFLPGNTAYCVITLVSACVWKLALKAEISRRWKTAAGCLFFMVLGFTVTRLTGMWMGRVNTPSKAYWNELAEAFLAGRMDLASPSGFHDLTQYNGKWYVPNPPLPGILLMPWVALLGSAERVNMCVADAVTAGINAGLLFLMLVLAYVRKGGPLYQPCGDEYSYPPRSFPVICWVTVLFVFGTDHLWLGTTGQMWFISQMLVITFTLLACICVIGGLPPVFAGIALGCGVLCRPNIFPVYLCLLGLWLHQEKAFPRLDLKKTFFWCLQSGIPVVIAAGLLLLYNKLRFDDWMDFGYVTINGADWILNAVREYGMFHPHFFKINADVMLFGLPRLDLSGTRFFFNPHVAGYSIFIMTPPLIWIFRSFRKDWFSVGSWASVLLTVVLLLFYHNTGAEQIGYRYILDAAAPLAMMTAAGTRGKVSGWFKFLTIFAVCLSFIAIYWWYLGRI